MFSKVDGLLKGKELALLFHYNNVNARDWQKIRGELALAGEVPLLVVKNRVAKRRILPYLSPPSPSAPQSPVGLDLGEKRGREEKDHSPSFSLEPLSSARPKRGSPFETKKEEVFHPKREQAISSGKGNGRVAAFDLLQGPTLLVGCNSLNDFKSVFSVLSKSGHFLLVGGIYNNRSINHSQLKRLLSLDTSLYTLLLQTLQTRGTFLLSLSQRYNFHFLSWYQRKLLFLLQQRLFNITRSQPNT